MVCVPITTGVSNVATVSTLLMTYGYDIYDVIQICGDSPS